MGCICGGVETIEKDPEGGIKVSKKVIYTNNIPMIKTKQGEKILLQLKKYICKIYYSNKNIGTGFMCKMLYLDKFKLLPVLITNNHVLNEEKIKVNQTINISFNDDEIKKILKLMNQE